MVLCCEEQILLVGDVYFSGTEHNIKRVEFQYVYTRLKHLTIIFEY